LDVCGLCGNRLLQINQCPLKIVLVLADSRSNQQYRHRDFQLIPPSTERRLCKSKFSRLAIKPRPVVVPPGQCDRRLDVLRLRR
jgi:hypothetical protein